MPLLLRCLWLASCLPGLHALRLALVSGPDPGHYDWAGVGAALKERGHSVTVWDLADTEDGAPVGTHLDEAAAGGHALDAVLAQESAAAAAADYAARAAVPLLRFLAPGELLSLLHERPAALVFPSQADLAAFEALEVMAGIPRVVLGPAVAAKRGAVAYKELEGVLEAGRAERAAAASAPAQAARQRPEGGEAILGVAMILKNENETIAQTLRSFRDEADFVTIVDTGSTDGTQDTIRRELEGRPHQLLEHPFEDFATTRNWALRAHGTRTAYVFMVDADFEVTGLWRMRLGCGRLAAECAARSVPACPKGIKMWLNIGASGFFTNRVFPTAGVGTEEGWRYVYPVHEVPGRPSIEYMNGAWIEDVLQYKHLQMHNIPVSHNKSPTRWKNIDLPLLTREHEAHPDDRRIMFYLAQTLDLIEDLPAALAMYQKRIDAGGWQQEVFEAHMRRGRIKHDRMEGVDPRPDFLAALAVNPDRAEPLIWMCWHYHKEMDRCPPGDAVCTLQNRVAAYHYARRAAEKPFPTGDTLFVNQPVYQYQAKEAVSIHAWHLTNELGDAFDVGYPMAREVAASHPSEWRLRNVELYEGLPQFRARAAARAAAATDHSEL